MESNTFLPALNASLNSAATLMLLLGFYYIKKSKRVEHERAMWAAVGFSAAFLTSYLYYHFNYESAKFTGTGWIRPVYFTILISHIVLAVAILPFVFRLLYLAKKGYLEKHKNLARKIWPLWLYTSITGVLIYLMLYQ